MPTTPVYALRYPASTDPADVPTDMSELALDVEGVFNRAASATPPASPADGQLWTMIADATAGVAWTFRYRAASASAYKWEFVGGPPLPGNVNAQETTTTTSSYVNLATVGPGITLTRPGVYSVSASAALNNSAADPLISFALGIGDYTSPVIEVLTSSGAAGYWSNPAVAGALITVATGNEIRMKYRKITAGTLTVSSRWIQITPLRIS